MDNYDLPIVRSFTIENEKTKEVISGIIQPYIIGLYLALYSSNDSTPHQICMDWEQKKGLRDMIMNGFKEDWKLTKLHQTKVDLDESLEEYGITPNHLKNHHVSDKDKIKLNFKEE